MYNCFLYFQKAFDLIEQEIIWVTLRSYEMDEELVQILPNIGEWKMFAVRFGHRVEEWFATTLGTRHPLSPTTFIIYLERLMDNIQRERTGPEFQCRQKLLKT